MAFISTAEQAVQQLSHLMKDSENPNDQGFLVNMGRAVLSGVTHLKQLVDLSGGKAQKGSVTVTISLHAFRGANKEIKCRPSVAIVKKLPSEFLKHDGEFYIGDQGELSTSPIARDQEKMWTPEVLDGGAPKAETKVERKAGKAI